jgi:hypothetical protein
MVKKHRQQIKLIAKAARLAGLQVTPLGTAGETMLGDTIQVGNGKRIWVVSTRKIGFFPNTKNWFKQLCNSKETSAKLLKKLGYQTIPSVYVGNLYLTNKEKFDKIVKQIKSFPVVCKPEDGIRGRSIQVVTNKQELYEYYTKSSREQTAFLIQPVITGNEYRLSVFEGTVFFVHNKNFYTMTGNGIDTILKLCQKRKSPPDLQFVQFIAKERGYAMDSVLPLGETMPVKVVKNDGDMLLTGKDIPNVMKQWAKSICTAIGCTTIGIDVIIPDNISNVDKYKIFEINASPAFAYTESRYPGTEDLVDQIAAHIVAKSFM